MGGPNLDLGSPGANQWRPENESQPVKGSKSPSSSQEVDAGGELASRHVSKQTKNPSPLRPHPPSSPYPGSESNDKKISQRDVTFDNKSGSLKIATKALGVSSRKDSSIEDDLPSQIEISDEDWETIDSQNEATLKKFFENPEKIKKIRIKGDKLVISERVWIQRAFSWIVRHFFTHTKQDYTLKSLQTFLYIYDKFDDPSIRSKLLNTPFARRIAKNFSGNRVAPKGLEGEDVAKWNQAYSSIAQLAQGDLVPIIAISDDGWELDDEWEFEGLGNEEGSISQLDQEPEDGSAENVVKTVVGDVSNEKKALGTLEEVNAELEVDELEEVSDEVEFDPDTLRTLNRYFKDEDAMGTINDMWGDAKAILDGNTRLYDELESALKGCNERGVLDKSKLNERLNELEDRWGELYNSFNDLQAAEKKIDSGTPTDKIREERNDAIIHFNLCVEDFREVCEEIISPRRPPRL